jgi:hypothetical protein
VGAQISVLAPLAIFGQPAAWAGVAASNERSNQSRVRSLNGTGSTASGVAFGSEGKPPILRSARRQPGS